MAASFPLRWTERTLFLTLVLSVLFKLFHPVTGIPISFSAWLFKLSVALLFFFYIAWPWLFAPPLQSSDRWDRILHFTAPLLWCFELLFILFDRSGIGFMEEGPGSFIFQIPEGILSIFVLILVIQRIHGAESKGAIRYYAWILTRGLFLGWLSHFVIYGHIFPFIS